MNEMLRAVYEAYVIQWDDSILDIFMNEQNADWRYASFDYCYNHFYKMNRIEDEEKSCAILWSYLSSWGMVIGSSALLQQNYRYLSEVVQYIKNCGKEHPEYWDITFPYCEKNIDVLTNIYNDVEQALTFTVQPQVDIPVPQPSNTLVTKVMLGVFGVVPAFDTYVAKFFKYLIPKGQGNSAIFNHGVNETTCMVLNQVETLKNFSTTNLDNLLQDDRFDTLIFDNNSVSRKYTRAKLIDMYCFVVGQMLNEAE